MGKESLRKALLKRPRSADYFSRTEAEELDAADPLAYTRNMFDLGETLPFAGHSLGPTFKPGFEAIKTIYNLQKKSLHAGHFPKTADAGGNWFDFDINPPAIAAARDMLGFEHDNEFIFTHTGLSDNLRMLLTTLVNLDWATGRTKICHLGTEFISDQAIIYTLLQQQIQNASSHGVFKDRMVPMPEALILKIPSDVQGLYNADSIVAYVKQHASEINVLHLSDIVANTGQRLKIPYILRELKHTIQQHRIIVGLDLAHTIGNRIINLRDLEVVSYAVACGYKHCSGTAGAPFGLYLNRKALVDRVAIRGWKGMESDKVFGIINSFDPKFLITQGAHALRASNSCVAAIAPTQAFVLEMHNIGWDKLIKKSEQLTAYMLALLKKKLGDQMQLITPEDPEERGATLVFQIKEIQSDIIERELAKAGYEIDVRPPNNIRITAHYGYTRAIDIYGMVCCLEHVVRQELLKRVSLMPASISLKPSLFFTSAVTQSDASPQSGSAVELR
jgi:kynureninase